MYDTRTEPAPATYEKIDILSQFDTSKTYERRTLAVRKMHEVRKSDLQPEKKVGARRVCCSGERTSAAGLRARKSARHTHALRAFRCVFARRPPVGARTAGCDRGFK